MKQLLLVALVALLNWPLTPAAFAADIYWGDQPEGSSTPLLIFEGDIVPGDAQRNPLMQAAVTQLRNYCHEMSGATSFYPVMMSVPFETLQHLTHSEALRLGVATE